jgi:RimJ/RimL family protein N-acetyltransferase
MEFKELTYQYTQATANCVREVLSPLEFYSEYARKQEIDKFNSDNLWQFVGDKSRYNIIAVDNREVVGFSFGIVDADVLFIIWVGMKGRYRQSNHMKTMLEMTETWCTKNNIYRIWCDTNQLNVPAIKFFEKMGYAKCGELKNFWYGHDYFLWEKTLNG